MHVLCRPLSSELVPLDLQWDPTPSPVPPSRYHDGYKERPGGHARLCRQGDGEAFPVSPGRPTRQVPSGLKSRLHRGGSVAAVTAHSVRVSPRQGPGGPSGAHSKGGAPLSVKHRGVHTGLRHTPPRGVAARCARARGRGSRDRRRPLPSRTFHSPWERALSHWLRCPPPLDASRTAACAVVGPRARVRSLRALLFEPRCATPPSARRPACTGFLPRCLPTARAPRRFPPPTGRRQVSILTSNGAASARRGLAGVGQRAAAVGAASVGRVDGAARCGASSHAPAGCVGGLLHAGGGPTRRLHVDGHGAAAGAGGWRQLQP